MYLSNNSTIFIQFFFFYKIQVIKIVFLNLDKFILNVGTIDTVTFIIDT